MDHDEEDDDLEDTEDDEDDDEGDDDEEDPETVELDDLLEEIDGALEAGLEQYVDAEVKPGDRCIDIELNDSSRWRLSLRKIA